MRVRLKAEQSRLLDWANVACMSESEKDLVVGRADRAFIVDVLGQQCDLLQRYGHFEARLQPLTEPLLSDGRQQSSQAQDSQTSAPDLPDVSPVNYPQSKKLMKKALSYAQATRGWGTRLRWAAFDKKSVEVLLDRLGELNNFLAETLSKEESNRLLELQVFTLLFRFSLLIRVMLGSHFVSLQTRTYYGVMQLNSSLEQVLDILKASSTAHLTNASAQNLADLAQVKALNLAILKGKGKIDKKTVDQLQLHYDVSQLDQHRLLSTNFPPSQNIPPARSILECPRTDTVYKGERSTNAEGVPVWIEWKHESVLGPSSITSEVTEVTEQRLAAMVLLLRHDRNTELFGVAPCLGYLREEVQLSEERHGPRDIVYGIVFEKPSGCDSSARPLSLLELLEPTPPPTATTGTGDATQSHVGQSDGDIVPVHPLSHLDVPSASKRVALARAITESVERLHAVNWLHKGIRSYNILLFPTEDRKETQSHALPSSMDNLDRLNFSKPTLSGFESARPEAESRWTEKAGRNIAHDLYRHPDLQQQGLDWDSSNSESARISFNKSFDVYSLGIVLLEIACWKPIHAILGINLEQARRRGIRETIRVRKRLLNEPVYLARVRSSMGDIMHDVIRACLGGLEQRGGSDLVDMNDPEYPLHFQEAFYEQVVRKLHTISI